VGGGEVMKVNISFRILFAFKKKIKSEKKTCDKIFFSISDFLGQFKKKIEKKFKC